MIEWQNDEDTADTGDETDTEEQRMSPDDGLGFEGGINDLSNKLGNFGNDLDGGLGDDEFGGFGDDSSEELAELENHVGELENEVSAISSGMSTVREENKQIGETVEELDDTIRKLLDIYKVVTRGINPFVDDTREMGGFDGGGAFGSFEAGAEDEKYLDPEVANANAESLFDDDFGELGAEEGTKRAELAAEDELAETEYESPVSVLDDENNEHSEAGEADETDDTDGADGVNFDDLRKQYEEDDGWDNKDDAATDGVETDLDDAAISLEDEDDDALDDADPLDSEIADDAEEDDEPGDEVSDGFETDPAPEIKDDEQDVNGDVHKTLGELEAEYTTVAGTKDGLSDDGEDGTVVEPESSTPVKESDAYLVALPSNYISEMLILE